MLVKLEAGNSLLRELRMFGCHVSLKLFEVSLAARACSILGSVLQLVALQLSGHPLIPLGLLAHFGCVEFTLERQCRPLSVGIAVTTRAGKSFTIPPPVVLKSFRHTKRHAARRALDGFECFSVCDFGHIYPFFFSPFSRTAFKSAGTVRSQI